jgi:hypothetical protein
MPVIYASGVTHAAARQSAERLIARLGDPSEFTIKTYLLGAHDADPYQLPKPKRKPPKASPRTPSRTRKSR